MSSDRRSAGITVHGEGRVSAPPDTLTLTIGVGVQRDQLAQATGDAAGVATSLIEALRAEGVAEADLRTSHYSIQPAYDRHGEGRRLAGYRVSNTLHAKLRQLDRAGATIDAAIAAGGNEVVVNGVGFTRENVDELVRQARSAAWTDARSRAQQLADLAGLTLGAAISIVETSSPAAPVEHYQSRLAMAEVDAVTPMQPGELEVSVHVEVTFDVG